MMANTEETSSAKYVCKLNDIENPARDNFQFIESTPSFGEVCCAKLCTAFLITALFCPFAICDIYYASTDTTCLRENRHNLTIVLQSYLLASGIITITCIGIADICIIVFDITVFSAKHNAIDPVGLCKPAMYCFNYILQLFSIAFLILGCVLFWGYTDIETCATPVKDYLFARFIIMCICSLFSIQNALAKN